MASLFPAVLSCLVLSASGVGLRAQTGAPITEKVFLGETQIWGHNIDESTSCHFPMPEGTSFKVCGKYTSVTFYLMSNCREDYGGHYHTLGPAGADACVSADASQMQWMQEMQSYKVTYNTGSTA